jgi:hypothetical protein
MGYPVLPAGKRTLHCRYADHHNRHDLHDAGTACRTACSNPKKESLTINFLSIQAIPTKIEFNYRRNYTEHFEIWKTPFVKREKIFSIFRIAASSQEAYYFLNC